MKLSIRQDRHRVRFHLSSDFLYSSNLFARRAKDLETSKDKPSDIERRDHRSCVISSILSAVAFTESTINEFYVICSEHPSDIHVAGHADDKRFNNIGNAAIQKIGAMWQVESFQFRARLLEKFQIALTLADKIPFDAGRNPFQDAHLVIQLRNLLVHFKPEEQEAALGLHNMLPLDTMGKKYQGKFSDNPLAAKFSIIRGPDTPAESDYPFFPEKCLGSGCAFWAFKSMLSLTDEFFKRLDTTWYYHNLFDKKVISR